MQAAATESKIFIRSRIARNDTYAYNPCQGPTASAVREARKGARTLDYNLMQTPGALVRRAQQLHAALWFKTFSDEFTSAQFAVLTAARRHPDSDQTRLSAEAALDTSTVQAVVLRLERAGMLTRTRADADRRRWFIRLTAKGALAVDNAVPKALGVSDQLLAGLDDGERQELTRLLIKIVETHPASIRPEQIVQLQI